MIEPTDPLPEDRFTRPTGRCPYPERWTSTDSESTEREVAEMIGGLVRGLQPDICLETGTAFGEVAEQIGIALASNGHGMLVTVESDPDRVAYAARRLRGLPVSLVHGDTLSVELGLDRLQGTLDFAWFDSYYLLRVPEFLRFRPFMRKGTIVGFHDTAPGHGSRGMGDESIRRVLERELADVARFVHLPTPRGLTLAEVL